MRQTGIYLNAVKGCDYKWKRIPVAVPNFDDHALHAKPFDKQELLADNKAKQSMHTVQYQQKKELTNLRPACVQ